MEAALPEGPRGRILALSLVLAVLLSAWFGCAVPVMQWYASRSELLVQRSALMQHMEQLAAMLPELRRQAANGRPQPAALLEGSSDAIAGAALQAAVETIAKRVGTSFSSIEVLPGEARAAYRRIGLRVELSAPWPTLIELLRAVKQGSASPSLGMLIDDLQIRAPPLQLRPASAPVKASFTIFAFRAAPDNAERRPDAAPRRSG